MRNIIISLLLLTFIAAGCATAPETKESKNVLSSQADEAIAVFKARDPSIDKFFTQSYGYAVFPKVGKGAFILGIASGRGEVFEQGQLVGYSSLSQASLGFSFGGESFREIIFFRDKSDLDRFRAGPEYTFAAQATGVALEEGVSAKADYKDGMAVFITSDKGLMVDASLGGQKFKYVPVAK
jgi:lipid-binding SYLF domain-containing protein